MRMRLQPLVILSLGLAWGCAPAAQEPAPQQPPPPAAVSEGRDLPRLDPARWPFTDGRPYPQAGTVGWGFMPHVRFAVFQAAEGRDYDLVLSCSDRNLSVHYFPPKGVTRDTETLTLISGGASSTLPAQYTPSHAAPPPTTGDRAVENQPSLDASALVSDAFFVAFLRTGQLSVSNSGRTLEADARPAETHWLRRFFKPCLDSANEGRGRS